MSFLKSNCFKSVSNETSRTYLFFMIYNAFLTIDKDNEQYVSFLIQIMLVKDKN